MSNESEPEADRGPHAKRPHGVVDATGSSPAIPQPSDPQVSLPTDQVATKTDIELPSSAQSDGPHSTSRSHHASRAARTNAAMPQAGPPTFTDPDLLVPAGVAIKTLHITELRTAINDLRAQRGLSAYSWQTSVTGSIKADPILEMRTALDQVLGPPPSPGYSAGLAQFQPILAIHIQELRNRVIAAWNAPVQIPVDGHANLSYDSATNRITTAGFAYDAAGNQVRALIPGSSGSQRFRYDAANRLVQVRSDDNNTVIASYTYGDSNERLILEEGGVRTYYACDGSAEYKETGGATTPQWSKTYIYLGARLLSTLTPNGSGGHFVQYHHPDRLGTRLVTNAQDTTYFEQQTLPFGTALNESPPAGGTTGQTNRRFTSYDRSLNTGLDYALNRHYDPQQGRFTQVDPIGMASTSLESPQTLNLYAYCTNDPVNHTDPDGLGFLSKIFKAISKALKIIVIVLVVVVVTALVIAYAAPAGSAWISFAKFLLFKVAPLLAAITGKTATRTQFGTLPGTDLPGGTPPWNGNGQSGVGNGFQGRHGHQGPAGSTQPSGGPLPDSEAPIWGGVLASVTIVAAPELLPVGITVVLNPSLLGAVTGLAAALVVTSIFPLTSSIGNTATNSNTATRDRTVPNTGRRHRNKWTCFARAHVKNEMGIPGVTPMVTGVGHGPTRGIAEHLARKNVSQNSPPGFHIRHSKITNCIQRF